MPKKASTSHFAVACQQMIDEVYEGTVARFSEHSGVNASTFGYYMRPGGAGRFPSVEMLAKIIAPLPEEWQRRIVVGYMQDHVPRGMEHLVKVSGAKGEAKPPALVLSKDVEEVFQRLRESAATDNNVRNWLLATGRAMLGK